MFRVEPVFSVTLVYTRPLLPERKRSSMAPPSMIGVSRNLLGFLYDSEIVIHKLLVVSQGQCPGTHTVFLRASGVHHRSMGNDSLFQNDILFEDRKLAIITHMNTASKNTSPSGWCNLLPPTLFESRIRTFFCMGIFLIVFVLFFSFEAA